MTNVGTTTENVGLGTEPGNSRGEGAVERGDRLPGIIARLNEADAAEQAGWGAFMGTKRERVALEEITSRCRTDLRWLVAELAGLRAERDRLRVAADEAAGALSALLGCDEDGDDRARAAIEAVDAALAAGQPAQGGEVERRTFWVALGGTGLIEAADVVDRSCKKDKDKAEEAAAILHGRLVEVEVIVREPSR